jgi:DHA3 family macrolide efflux protein-like MFS transporter
MGSVKDWKKPFFTIYIGQAFSLLSSSAVQFAIIWWLTVETGSAIVLTIASIVGLLPQALIGPFAGVWVDRFNRKRIMIIADGAVAAASMMMFIAFLFGKPDLWLIFVILFLRAIGETFHKPALQSAIPQFVPASELTKAGGFGQMISSVCTMFGPVLGALLMSMTTLGVAMLVDVAGAALAVTMLSMVKIEKHKTIEGQFKVFKDLKEGFNAIKSNKPLTRAAIPVFLCTLVFVPLGILFPLLVKSYFNGTAWQNGLVQTLFSIGMVVSAAVIGITGGLKKLFTMISVGIIAFGISSLVIGILPRNMFWLFCIIVFLIGAASMLSNIPFISYIQKTVPQENLGKVISLVTSVMSFAAPFGMLIAGPLSEFIGVDHWMLIVGALMLLIGLISFILTRKYDKITM